jgi:ribonuclease J
MDSTSTLYEEDVCGLLSKEMAETKGLVLANWPARDTDRLISFFQAAKENGRILVLNTKQANLLEKLSKVNNDVPKITDKDIRIFLTRKSWGLIDRKGLPDDSLKAGDYDPWERTYIDHPNMVDYNELRKNHSAYVVRADLFDMSELVDLQPDGESKYVRSTCEPFDDKMEFNEAIIDAWLNHFRVRKTKTIHCSGHAPGPDLKRIIEEIKPKRIIPIHTERAEDFKGIHGNVKIPENEKTLEL